jgi:hypothetical protein
VFVTADDPVGRSVAYTRRASASGCCRPTGTSARSAALKEPRLLDAAHIVPDTDAAGEPAVTNGLSLCSIHHRAFDEDLVGISPDYEVRVHPRLLDDEDGPMLELLKGAHERRSCCRAALARDPIASSSRCGSSASSVPDALG